MSFGNLNILMHKDWHVWRSENVEKVLKDEKKHREEEAKKKQDQIQRVRLALCPLPASFPFSSICDEIIVLQYYIFSFVFLISMATIGVPLILA